jgi:hypothetical protein
MTARDPRAETGAGILVNDARPEEIQLMTTTTFVTLSSETQVDTDAVKAAVAEAGHEVVDGATEVAGACCGGATCSTPSTGTAP